MHRHEKSKGGAKVVIAIFLIAALVGGIIYFAYSQGMFDPKEPEVQLPECIGKLGKGSQALNDSVAYDIDIIDEKLEDNNGKFAAITVFNSSIASDAEKLDVTVIETHKPESIVVQEDYNAAAYYIGVDGLVENNTTPIKVKLYVGTECESAHLVAVYCEDKEIKNVHVSNGYATFETTELGIFTVVIEPDAVIRPVAKVTYEEQYVNVDLPWGNFGGWSPTPGLDNQLEAAFKFVAPHTAENISECEFKDWICDFYVQLDRELGANQIFLGGNYGDFGWVGFHNGDLTLPANEPIALLGSVTQNPWTYSDIATFVGTFICGVGDVDDALEGATFTVSLRLTNPNNSEDFYDVNVVKYIFGGTYEMTETHRF